MDPKPENHAGQPEVSAEQHQLPPVFVGTLFACLLGGLVPGVYMTLVSDPGQKGSPVYGLLLPWSILPFILAVSAGWVGRRVDAARAVRTWAVVGAVLGLVGYTYFMMIHPKGVRNIRVFLYLPLWQWVLLARPMMRTVLAARALRGESGQKAEGES